MGIHLHVSNSLKGLSRKLSTEMGRNCSVFQPYYIITQTEGMSNWLKIQLAEADQLGIAANCRFLKPNDIVHTIYKLLGGEKVRALPLEGMQWIYFKVLGEEKFTEVFKDVAAYYKDHDAKRLALAQVIADLFDQYQIYRPDFIKKWNSSLGEEATAFQEYLWKRVKVLTEGTLPDKTLTGDYILQALSSAASSKALASIPALYFFGLSIFTEYHLQLFSALAKHIDIHFLLLNPSPSVYWFEDRSAKAISLWKRAHKGKILPPEQGNDLLTSWGRIIQDSFSLFLKEEELVNTYEECHVARPIPDTLLGKLQHDIFYCLRKDEVIRISEEELHDGTLTINACHTPAREVEVLYNYLVDLVEHSREPFSARDVVVMVSEMDTYAPYIRAVFDTGRYSFPYTIADESYKGSGHLLQALETVLCLEEDSFKAEDVLQLLDISCIRKRFAIRDTELLRRLVHDACFRFGTRGSKEDDSIYMSCENALRRIMFGLCMAGDQVHQFMGEDFYPLDVPEGSEAVEAVKFCHFAQVLMAALRERQESRTLTEWGKYIEVVVQNLLSESEDEVDEEYTILLREVHKLYAIDSALQEKVSFTLFRQSFLKQIAGHSRSQTFLSKGLTFCSLIPMRSIPFKVVALLGMNMDKFPRKETPIGFSLLQERKPGDRNIKENDKHLFLETLLSAQQQLYISYIGRSDRDNKPIPPSPLVDELLDYITRNCEKGIDVQKELIAVHPLHGFSNKYNAAREDGDEKSAKRMVSYLIEELEGENAGLTGVENKSTDEPLGEISLEALVNFFKNPFKTYYKQVLGITYDDGETLLPGSEVFTLDHLQQWQIKRDLLFLNESQMDEYRSRQVMKGVLPLKNMAGVEVAAVKEDMREVYDLFHQCIKGKEPQKKNIEVRTEDIVLRGQIHTLYDATLVVVSFSSRECKYLLEAYIRYLALVAQGEKVDVSFISYKHDLHFKGVPLSQVEALDRLQALITIYQKGHQELLAYYPDFGITPDDLNEFGKTVQRVVKDTFEKYTCSDKYILREYQQGFFDAVEQPMFENYRKILVPVSEVFPEYYATK